MTDETQSAGDGDKSALNNLVCHESDDKFVIDLSRIGNVVELKQFYKFEGGKMVSYGYSIERDRHGCEVSRTEPEALSSIGWDDGTPFTNEDYLAVKCGRPAPRKRGFFSRLFGG
jgi:hypothetical protein